MSAQRSPSRRSRTDLYEISRPLVIGNRGVLERAARPCRHHRRSTWSSKPAEGRFEVGTIDLLDRQNVDLPTLEWGQVQAQAGRAAFDQIKTAIELAMAGEIEAMATAPINKEAMQLGGVPVPRPHRDARPS